MILPLSPQCLSLCIKNKHTVLVRADTPCLMPKIGQILDFDHLSHQMIKATNLPAKALNRFIVAQITDDGVAVKSMTPCYVCSSEQGSK